MPLYDYECQKIDCGHKFLVILSLDEKPPKKCPKCGSKKMKKVISGVPKVMGKQKR